VTTAREIMTSDATCVGEQDSIATASRRLAQLGVGAMPICGRDDKLKGMLTDRDIVVKVLAEGRNPNTTTTGEVAQGRIVTVDVNADAEEILRTMGTHKVRRLPVLDGPRMVGIVALADVARAMPEHAVGDLMSTISHD